MIQIGSNKWDMQECIRKAIQLSLDNPGRVIEIHEDVGMRYIVVGETGADGRATFCYSVRDGKIALAREWA